ncbi:MAG: hypothetical protein FWH34_02945 [Desulfovibrionaceae bacterium]|nr:hypothetical protein [Desulfovibrionaceae bacterium]
MHEYTLLEIPAVGLNPDIRILVRFLEEDELPLKAGVAAIACSRAA